MIIVRLIGGLGNQMFQYSVGRALADTCGCKLKLDVSGFEDYSLRRYELGELRIRADIASVDEITRFREVPPPHPIIDRLKKAIRWQQAGIFRERAFTFDPDVLNIKSSVYLDGYWQSEKYFSGIADALRRDFTPSSAMNDENHTMLERIMASESISLHVRRGDYVTNPNTAKYHGVCSLDYYRDAVEYIASHTRNPHFFVFSDDTGWVADNLKIDHPMTLVNVNGPDQGIWDMNLMKSCQHHIIANSSFSWWGAWLNPSSAKQVVAPRRWFNEGGLDTRDLIPESWVRL
ncbi:GDP-Fuc:beta-D-Gal-1,3-alpha-D-GalNAc-1, 3-alpha-GalNAc-diphosphoundecaprenol alpha-1,2-fucosyltransferase [Methylococcales bacterium]|nr:GDP-Fuc:beta-D-Gal-1,3-alpha-D-GalNAc-1, 3-alpha-GalNAc-diphosphoundecaprenol alpha-1,2-fucosyltransferase [Methylococcales bacterium]